MLAFIKRLFSKKKEIKAKSKFGLNLKSIFKEKNLNQEIFDNIEEKLIKSDLGVALTKKILKKIKENIASNITLTEVNALVKTEILSYIPELNFKINYKEKKPAVILFIGVNGSGKTTSIGKIAQRYQKQGMKILLAACDTYRAAAAEQLEIWAKRSNVDIVMPEKEGIDPASVAFKAVEKGLAENYDIIFIDTAGRLQNDVNLMNQLGKVERVINKQIPDAPHETIMVIDGTTGQNALKQVNEFKKYLKLSGMIITKLDGTATGGIVLSLMSEEKIPTYYVGFGEKAEDLKEFSKEEFVDSILL